MTRRVFHLEKFATYDAVKRKSTCIIETCRKELSGKVKANIKRHYKLVHRQDIESDIEIDSEEDQSDATIEPKKKKRKVEEVTIDTPNQDHNTVNNTLAAGANESFNRPQQNFTVLQMPQTPQNQQHVQIQQQQQQKQHHQHQEQQATSRISDSCQQIAQIWGLKLAKMSRMQRIIAEKVVNEVMFNGELGLLNVNTALTNIGSRLDTDPIGSIDAENEEEFITIENKNIFDL
ncbi:SUN domain-containing protein 2-like isoform X3 [Lucilia cuprina]|uniref:SUN domain-containing protein 2-like isoform X3 n=1 Tax=Lucilia cuprina TaxID=7375 RepID=UPI001F06AF89|nr:SUN domain-containing protein 2-like isoform X3 [Lucilia cuprina]